MKKNTYRNNKSLAEEIFAGVDRKIAFRKLVKGTFIMTAAPALIILLFVIYGFIIPHHALILLASIFVLSLLFIYPYLADLQELTRYVANLVINKPVKKPSLSFLGNVEELSYSITSLQKSWSEKNKNLQALIEEDKILMDNLPDIIIMLDKNLDEIGVSQASENLFGKAKDKIVKGIISSDLVKISCHEVLSSGMGKSFTYEVKEPKHFFFSTKIERFPVDSPSKIAVIIVMQDITKERATQQLLQDFVSNASHEMKTPLASISGFLETMIDTEIDDKTRKEFYGIMQQQSERLKNLISDLLTLSVVQSGAKEEKLEKLNLSLLLSEAEMGLGNFISDKKINYKSKVEKDLPDITGNRDEVLRVFDNLISNAVKYSPEKSNIKASLSVKSNSECEFEEYHHSEKFVCFSVTDNGEGIAAEDIPRLTERFFRVDKSRSAKVSGTGLGLAIVKHILNNHRAKLVIESEIEKGSTFSVYFPYKI